jgi:peroxisomal membrane protein 2
MQARERRHSDQVYSATSNTAKDIQDDDEEKPKQPDGWILRLAWRSYQNQLKQNPLQTKALTSAAIAGISDIIAQLLLTGEYQSIARTCKVAMFGFCWSGPATHYWQDFLQRLFHGQNDILTVMKKVFIDQMSFGPIMNVAFMAFVTLALEGRDISALGAKILHDYPLVQLNGWKVWPLAALINYRFVPLQFRVLFVNLVALGWSTFLLLRSRAATHIVKKP